MLQRLGFKRFAYDWRAEHIPMFDAEMDALKRHDIRLEAVWFPAALHDDARTILDLLRRHKLHAQLWVTMGDPAPEAKDLAAKVSAAARALRPIATEAAKIGCSVALYNHGGWFGERENQLAVIEELTVSAKDVGSNIGIVYNLHHGHEHLGRFGGPFRRVRLPAGSVALGAGRSGPRSVRLAKVHPGGATLVAFRQFPLAEHPLARSAHDDTHGSRIRYDLLREGASNSAVSRRCVKTDRCLTMASIHTCNRSAAVQITNSSS